MHFLSPSILPCFLPGSMASAAAELRSGLWRLKSDCQGTEMTTLSGALATALPQLAQKLGCQKPVMNFFGWGKEIRCARFSFTLMKRMLQHLMFCGIVGYFHTFSTVQPVLHESVVYSQMAIVRDPETLKTTPADATDEAIPLHEELCRCHAWR